MGSGISLSEKHIADIVKRDLKKDLNDYENTRDRYCDGYEIYYDFSEEAEYLSSCKKIDKFVNENNKDGSSNRRKK